MNYDVSQLFTASSCRIVFTEDTQTATDLAKAVTRYDPAYHDRINGVLASRIGFFNRKNRKSVWNILKNTGKSKEEGAEFLRQQTERIDIGFYKDRRPAALSHSQKERVSVLYDTLCGRTQFLLSDCVRDPDGEGFIFSRLSSHYFTVADFLNTYHSKEKSNYDLILITGMPETDLLDYISREDFFSPVFTFYRAEGGSVVKCDKQALISEIIPSSPEIDGFCKSIESRRMTKEQKFSEGCRYDRVPLQGTTQNTEDAKRAFLWYAAAALDGYLPAQNMLGLFYEFGNGACEPDTDRALFWYAKAAFHKGYSESSADRETKHYHQAAKENLERLAIRMPGAAEKIRRYGGKAGEELIGVAELKQAMEEKPLVDPEYIRKIMDKAMNKNI